MIPPTPRTPWPLGLLLALAVACGGDASIEPTEGSLLDRLDRAVVDSTAGELLAGGPLPAPRPDALLLAEQFGTWPRPGWLDGVQVRELRQEREQPGESSLRLVDDTEARRGVLAVDAASRGLHHALTTQPGRALRVTARIRFTPPPGDELPSLTVSVLKEELPAEGQLLALLRRDQTLTPRAREEARPDPELADGWQDLTVVIPRDQVRQTLWVSLLPHETSDLRIARLEVRRLSACEELGQLAPTSAESSPWRRKVEIDGQMQDCLLAPVPTRVSFGVRIPDKAPRLDLAPAVLALGDAGRVQFRVLVDGDPIAEREARARGRNSNVPFTPWVVPLDDYRGRNVRLTLESDGTEGLLALVGSPELLGRTTTGRRPSLVLVSVDTLRADRLGCYGRPGDSTPALDRLAGEGALFEAALAPSSYTLPSHASLLSGQHPLVHGATTPDRRLDRVRSPLLAAALRHEGYATAAFTGGGFVDPAYGFGRGFDVFDTADPCGVPRYESPVPELGGRRGSFAALTPALDWLERHADGPFFQFLHTFFVHNYVPRPEDLAAVDCACAEDLRALGNGELQELARQQDGAAAGHLLHLYDATVRGMDRRFLAPLRQRLRELGAEQTTLFVLVADHGEQFLEHDEFGHGRFLWSELVDVPIVLAGPGVPHGIRPSGPARLEDVVPTLARLLDLEPDPRWTGRDLLRDGTQQEVLLSVRGTLESDALLAGPWKLIRHRSKESSEVFLFHADDPLEAHDLAQEQREVVDGLLRRMDEHVEAATLRAELLGSAGEAGAVMDPELEKRLRELGYLRDG